VYVCVFVLCGGSVCGEVGAVGVASNRGSNFRIYWICVTAQQKWEKKKIPVFESVTAISTQSGKTHAISLIHPIHDAHTQTHNLFYIFE
jgi:hypothetical protein